MSIKIIKKVNSPSATAMATYPRNRVVRRPHVPNLRFGQIAFCTDADVDG